MRFECLAYHNIRWELVEVLRRFLLVGVAVLVSPGSITQLVVATVVSLVYLITGGSGGIGSALVSWLLFLARCAPLLSSLVTSRLARATTQEQSWSRRRAPVV